MFKLSIILGSRARRSARTAVAFCVASSLTPVAVTAGMSFDDALSAAEARAPELRARRHAIDGAENARVAAGRLPDPKLIVGLDNVPVEGPDAWSLDRDFMTMRRVGFMQEVPNSEKLRAETEVAAAMAERERNMLSVDRLIVRRDTAIAWLGRYYLERQLVLLDDLDRETQLLIKTTQAQIAGGHGTPVDATMARQEATLLAERRDELVRLQARAKATLARFVGPEANDSLVGEPPAFRIDPEQLRAQMHRHPELAVYDSMTAQAAAEVRAAAAEKRTNWAVELAYQKRGSAFSDMASLQFTFDLPIFSGSRQDPRIYAKREDEERVAAERETTLRKHNEELESWLSDYDALSQKLKRTKESWLPLAREKADLLLASYRAGRAPLSDTLGARRQLIEARMKAIELEAELRMTAAKLSYLTLENPS